VLEHKIYINHFQENAFLTKKIMLWYILHQFHFLTQMDRGQNSAL